MALTKAKTFTPALALNKYKSGQYYTLPIVSTQTGNANSGFLVVFPLYFPNITIDRIGCLVTVAAGAGSLGRLGIYYSSLTDCYPGALLLDAGTVSVASTGNREITISQTIAEGIYWLAYLADTVVTSAPTMRQQNVCINPFAPITSTNTLFQTGVGFRAGGVSSGGLPATFPAGASDLGGTGGIHIIYTRIA
jgi:hypothetical protein